MKYPLYRFDTPAAVVPWQAIDDRVMGGVSASHMRHDPAGHGVFAGEVSLENNGGFASVRAPVRPPEAATAAAAHVNHRNPTIGGGTNEIQRNIISKMILGL